jgi:O-acetyl-ADP-ribose deacetylase (regulator of RNase III)
MPIVVVNDSILNVDADVIVTAANPALAGIGPDLLDGVGGVDGVIHRASGPDLFRFCMKIDPVAYDSHGLPIRCLPGNCVVTPSFNLKRVAVIHGVAPDLRENKTSNMPWDFDLSKLYCNIFAAFADLSATSIVFPAIGTGTYGLPKSEAARIATECAQVFILANVECTIFFAIIDQSEYLIYRDFIPHSPSNLLISLS